MKERKTTPFSRLLAALLATVLLIGMLPLSALPVYAEDELTSASGVPVSAADDPVEVPAITLTVQTKNEKPLKDATVTYRITRTFEQDGVSQTVDIANATKETNPDGRVELLSSAEFQQYLEDTLTLTASVELTGWGYAEGFVPFEDAPISVSNSSFIVPMTVPDDAVKAKTGLVYTGEPQELIETNNLLEHGAYKDTIEYYINGEQVNGVPTGTDAITYSGIKVKVTRTAQHGSEPREVITREFGSFNVKINPAEIDNIQVYWADPNPMTYDGGTHQLVNKIVSLLPNDKVTVSCPQVSSEFEEYEYFCDPSYFSYDAGSRTLLIDMGPNGDKADDYVINVKIERPDQDTSGYDNGYANYRPKDFNNTIIIQPASFEAQLDADLYTGENGNPPIYDPDQSHKVVTKVLRNNEDITESHEYCIKYQMVKAEDKPEEWPTAWADIERGVIPEVTPESGAGKYWIAIQIEYLAEDGNYDESTALLVKELNIQKRDQVLTFNTAPKHYFTIETEPGPYDFSCTSNSSEAAALKYELERVNPQDAATINNDGKVTVTKPCAFRVNVSSDETDNYKYKNIQWDVTVGTSNNDVVRFENPEPTYYLDTNGKYRQAAQYVNPDDKGKMNYYFLESTVEDEFGLTINRDYGTVEVVNWDKLQSKMFQSSTGTVSVGVTVTKAAYDPNGWFFGAAYPYGEASYTLKIAYRTPDPAINLIKSAANDFEWYNGSDFPAEVSVGESPYVISFSPTPPRNNNNNGYGDSVTISEELGETEKSYRIFIADSAPNAETNKTYVYKPRDIKFSKIDTTAPDTRNMSISYSETVNDAFKPILFFNPKLNLPAIITFQASDEKIINDVDISSGPYTANWTYREEGQSTAAKSGTVIFNSDGTATLTLPLSDEEQYRGNLSFTVTDYAGNTSEELSDDGTVIIVDSINPNCMIEYSEPNQISKAWDSAAQKFKRYFADPVTADISVEESNFWPEDFNFYISKDGDTLEKIELGWNISRETNTAFTTYRISSEENGSNGPTGDGDYVVYAGYKDRSGNIGDFSDSLQDRSPEPDLPALPEFDYVSDIITIDKTNPELSFDYKADDQIVEFTVKERNFSSGGFTFDEFTIQDLRGEPIEGSEDAIAYLKGLLNDASRWSTETDENGKSVDDEYRISLSAAENAEIPDGIYHIVLSYKDPAGHVSESKTVEFTFDRTPPTGIKIEFSEDLDYPDGKIEGYKFYNPTVDVTFTATDLYSGVKAFTWGYTKQDGASTTNHPERLGDTVEAYVRNPDEDGAVFTATVRLPLEAAQQLRGSFNVKAADAKDNISETIQDNTVIVVDTVKPTIGVQYSPYSNEVGKTSYYGIDKDGQVQVKMTITEANFFEGDVKVSITKDGAPYTTPAINWSSVGSDKHEGTFTLGGKNNIYDGLYKINVTYTDRSGNVMDAYNSDPIVLDYTKPVITVTYQNRNGNTMRDANGNNRTYFNQPQTATVTIVERNFNADDVRFAFTAKDVTGANLANPTPSNWTSSGDTHTCTISYPGDANYSFDVDYTDLATNAADDYAPDYFTVDKTAPRITGITYSPSSSRYSNDKIGYYDRQMTVTVTVEDDTSGVNSFLHNYGDGASNISMSNDGKTATITFNIPTGALGANNQFNGTVKFSVIDRSGNKTDGETKTIVADNIKPVMSVSYSPAKKESAADHDYYDGPVTVTVSIDEANFFPEDFQLVLDGQSFTINNWSSANGKHTGSFVIQQDGEHSFTIDYADRSGNKMEPYASNVVTVDTKLDAPRFTINGSSITSTDPNDPSLYLGGAYSDAAKVGFSFGDENFKSYKITLTQTNYAKKNDVTDPYVKSVILPADSLAEPGEKSFEALFDIPKKVENDGIYLLTIEMTDKAGHSVTSTLKFTINRYGSVYKYSDDLLALIENGGAHVQVVDGNIYIEEYNANEVENGTVHILVTRDGVPVELTPQIDTVNINGVAWHHYIYTIPNSAFAADGYYQITISSTDKDGNTSTSVPENLMSRHADGTPYLDIMSFTVDTIPPEIRSIVNLEKPIADRDKIVDGKLPVTYTLVDVGGLASFEVWLDGKRIDVDCVGWNPDSNDPENHYFANLFGEDLHYYTGTFYIPESSEIQHVRIKATDLAGNWTDTDKGYSNEPDKEFTTDLFEFNKDITVSTNALVRWYRNTPVFWGTIGGAGVLGSGFGFLFAKKRKKDEEEVVPEGEQKA